MNRPRPSGTAAVSQFQLIGNIRHAAGDCLTAVEPGGAAQVRKGALYVVTEPAGDPALGGEACHLAGATLAHEYYADPSPSLTTSLTTALNKANMALIQYNRQVLAAGDPPVGLPRKIRVGLSAVIVRPGQLYLCQLKPGLILWMHQGVVTVFPRPRAWSPVPPTPNGDGEIVGSFYAAPALGTAPVVEADYAFRRFDSGDLLVLGSSNLAPLLDEIGVAGALPGRAPAEVVEYLHNLARAAGLAEAHALAVELSAAPVSGRAGSAITLPPPPAWAPAADPPRARELPPAPVPSPAPAPAAPMDDHRIIQLRPRGARSTEPAAPPPAPAPGSAPPAVAATPPEIVADAAIAPDEADWVDLPAEPAPGPVRGLLDRARHLGQRARSRAGGAGRATLDAAGTVLGQTLPENVRRRGADGILHPDGRLVVEEAAADEPDAEPRPRGSGPGIVDFDAPGWAPSPPPPPFPWLRWAVPIVVVLLVGVVVIVAQRLLAGQQTAKVDVFLTQARQEETDSHQGPVPVRRDHLLKAIDQAQKALDLNPRSSEAAVLTTRLQQGLDGLNGVTRLDGLSLLYDFGGSAPVEGAGRPLGPAPGRVITSALAGGTPAVRGTPTLAPALLPPQPGDYLSQVVVHGDDAFLLDRGGGKLYRLALSTGEATPLLTPGAAVDLVGSTQKVHVGALLFATWRPTPDGGDLAVLDDTHTAYIWTAGGTWQAFALGGADKLDRPRDLGAYDGNLYLLLAKPGQISKWAAGAYGAPPLDWLSSAASNEIRSRKPVAMAIDGDIQILLDDGRIVTLSAGEIKNTIALPVWPQVTSPLAIFSTEATHSIYVVEAAGKRIIRVDKAGGAVQGQLQAPIDSPAFDGLRNVYVDEAVGKIYVLSGKKLFVAPLPALPAQVGPPAPALPVANPSPTRVPLASPTPTPPESP